MLVLVTMSALAMIAFQDPPVTAEAAPAQRSADQARLDVCLFTPAGRRSADCEPLLQAEADLLPDAALAVGDAMAWSGQACPPDQFAQASARSDCRREQRDLFRRADRARQALAQGAAGGVYAETVSAGAPAQTGIADSDGLGFSESRRPVGENCEQSASNRRDPDTGDSSSNYRLICSYGSDDPDLVRRNREMLDRLGRD